MGDFGDKFRKAREAKNISLDDVSNVTKIGARMLQAIEEEHFDVLPGGVFNKGFIRAYAKHLGLNDEEAVSDYLACLRQAQIQANEVREPQPPPARKPAIPEKRTQPMTTLPSAKPPATKAQPPKPATPVKVEELPNLQLPRADDVRPPRHPYPGPRDSAFSWRIAAASAVVIVLAALLWIRHSRLTRTEAASANAPAVHETNPSPTPSTQPSPTPNPSSTASVATVPGSPVPNAPAPKDPAPSRAESPAHSADTAKSPVPASKAEKDAEENDVTVRIPAKPAPPAKSAAPMTLVIRATENTWISVLADGQLVNQETLIAPANITVRATREITVRVGNAAGVTFLWNNQEVPAQGAEAEVKTLVFDASGMREASAQPAQ